MTIPPKEWPTNIIGRSFSYILFSNQGEECFDIRRTSWPDLHCINAERSSWAQLLMFLLGAILRYCDSYPKVTILHFGTSKGRQVFSHDPDCLESIPSPSFELDSIFLPLGRGSSGEGVGLGSGVPTQVQNGLAVNPCTKTILLA
jgi:hypothetical protein